MKVTIVNRQYENKVFSKGQFKQFALNVAGFCNLSLTDLFILILRKGTDTSIRSTVEDLINICGIGKTINCLAFHSSFYIIKFRLQIYSNDLNVQYNIKGNIENAKQILYLTENTLELTRHREQGTGELSFDNVQSFGNTQVNGELRNILINNELSTSLKDLWQRALNLLKSLIPIRAYENWIAPIVPSLDGNHLILECADKFAKDLIENCYKKDIIKIVRSIKPSVEGIIVRVSDFQSDERTNKHECIEIEESLFDLMKQVYERETENSVGSFDEYFNQVIMTRCLERIDNC
ncbi:DnaA N-terminal domain-containing protein [Desulfosporosinus sp. FKB]|uniref:DnaA N-terminal domain-containing protein n=1 Tax=Desulfosporosinus sp. FKB TaxID=1969835 RepID=UPI000B49E85C|nr:DnaA N-terminal domain-containing protein [Desulfosporosinus sp. FKB]